MLTQSVASCSIQNEQIPKISLVTPSLQVVAHIEAIDVVARDLLLALQVVEEAGREHAPQELEGLRAVRGPEAHQVAGKLPVGQEPPVS